jgi:hypothetical protein
MAKLMTIDGSFVELPSAPDGYILCLVKCRMPWLAPDDLLNHHIPPDLDESPGSFPDAAIIATSDGEGNRWSALISGRTPLRSKRSRVRVAPGPLRGLYRKRSRVHAPVTGTRRRAHFEGCIARGRAFTRP